MRLTVWFIALFLANDLLCSLIQGHIFAIYIATMGNHPWWLQWYASLEIIYFVIYACVIRDHRCDHVIAHKKYIYGNKACLSSGL